jgi:hypothetical protein
MGFNWAIKGLNAELNPICHLLALLAHHIIHVNSIRVKDVAVSPKHRLNLNKTQEIRYILRTHKACRH